MKSLPSELIRSLLKTEVLGKVIYSFGEVGSTNEVAFELAKNGAPEGTVVITDSQTKGRGRLGRKWISPPRVNLYMSVVFRPKIAVEDAPLLTLVASIALVEVVRGEGAGAFIKWPNDVVVNGKKMAGILTEIQPGRGRIDFAIAGIGVNLNMTREMMEREMGDIAETATSLKESVGHEVDRPKFTVNLISGLEVWYLRFLKGERSLIIKEWVERWGDVDRRVRVKFDGKVIEGVASGVDEAGYLLVKKDDGTVDRIISGDVILL
jgi:BirA family biotin operon repressor/biotin-[acetyl-CoA-carboxylase] ligase